MFFASLGRFTILARLAEGVWFSDVLLFLLCLKSESACVRFLALFGFWSFSFRTLTEAHIKLSCIKRYLFNHSFVCREMDRARGDVRLIHWTTFSSDAKSSDSSSHHPKFDRGRRVSWHESLRKGNTIHQYLDQTKMLQMVTRSQFHQPINALRHALTLCTKLLRLKKLLKSSA